MVSRRDVLKGGAAVAVSAMPVAQVIPVPSSPAPATPMLAWSFDIRHGDYRDTVIAATKAEAHAAMIADHYDCELHDECPRRMPDSEAECTHEDCECGDLGVSEVSREPRLDKAAARGQITIDDYCSAGWGYVCHRCGGEPLGGDWEAVGGEAACHDCMTIEEWRTINPAYAAELEEGARIDAMTDEQYEREIGTT